MSTRPCTSAAVSSLSIAPVSRPIGFVVVQVHDDPRRGEIFMIAVDPDYQNRGIGLALVDFATDRITELGLPLAEIGTGGDPGHAPARYVYEKAGFTPVPLVRYYKVLPAQNDSVNKAPGRRR